MPTVKNLSYGHLSIARAEKDPLTLGPRETADISDVEFDSDEIQNHLRERRIAIIPGAQADGGKRAARGGGRPRQDAGGGSGASTPTE
jgi:hypothetical protein